MRILCRKKKRFWMITDAGFLDKCSNIWDGAFCILEKVSFFCGFSFLFLVVGWEEEGENTYVSGTMRNAFGLGSYIAVYNTYSLASIDLFKKELVKAVTEWDMIWS